MKTTFLNLTIILTLPLSGVVFAEDFSDKSNDGNRSAYDNGNRFIVH